MLAAPAGGWAAEPSLDEMAGQMILVGFTGKSVAETRSLAEQIGQGGVGGIMYLKPNVASLAEVRRMNAAFAAARPDLPPFIALDQEGGAVERLTKAVGFTEIPSARDIARSLDPAGAEKVYAGMAEALRSDGFNLNFGPVVDLDINPDNPVIARYGRSYGADVDTVVRYASAFIDAHHAAGMLTALKHFPGHGSSTGDSHAGFVDISKTWKIDEVFPFQELIAAGKADMVMIAHLYHSAYNAQPAPHDPVPAGDYLDPGDRLPASLSPFWIKELLRYNYGFDGVVITDDLEMGAIRQHFTLAETVKQAVLAGADILLFSNTVKPRLSLADEVRRIMVAEAERDPAFRARIVESYGRIVALKKRIL